MKGEVKMENKLRGSYDKVFSAREGLPDEVKRLYEAMGHLAFSKKMYPQLLGLGFPGIFEENVSTTGRAWVTCHF